MTAIKIATSIACGILLLLGILIVFAQNPEQKSFDDTVELLMEREGLTSSSEVIKSFPELEQIESKMQQISQLKTATQRLTGGPAPNPSIEEQRQIELHRKNIEQLREEVHIELRQLMTLPISASH